MKRIIGYVPTGSEVFLAAIYDNGKLTGIDYNDLTTTEKIEYHKYMTDYISSYSN